MKFCLGDPAAVGGRRPGKNDFTFESQCWWEEFEVVFFLLGELGEELEPGEKKSFFGTPRAEYGPGGLQNITCSAHLWETLCREVW